MPIDVHPAFEGFAARLAALAPQLLLQAAPPDRLVLIASNGDFEARVTLPAPGIGSQFNAVVSGKLLADLVAAAHRPLTMEAGITTLTFRGDGRRFNLPLNTDPYALPALASQKLSAPTSLNYRAWKAACLFAKDFAHLSHQTFSNLYVGNGSVWGTDSFRASRTVVPLLDPALRLSMPAGLAATALRLFDQANAQTVDIRANERVFMWSCGDVQFTGVQGDLNFPALERLFALSGRLTVNVEREALLDALRFLVRDDREDLSMRVCIERDNLSCVSGDLAADVPCTAPGQAEFWVHRRYWLAMVEHLSTPNLQLRLGAANDPIYMCDASGKEAVLLPLVGQ